MTKYILLTWVLLIFNNSFAQQLNTADSVNYHDIYSVGIGAHYGFIFAHSKDVQNTKGAHPWAVELDINRQIVRNESWKECRCYPRTGLVLSYFNLNNEVLGQSFNAAWYIEPFLSTSHRFNLSMKGAAGLSYLTNPYDAETNPENMSYSMHINAYLALGLGGNFKIGRNLSAKISAYYNHISNGGLKDPNKGINWPAATVQIFYVINPAKLPDKNSVAKKDYTNAPLRKDVIAYLTQKDVYFIGGAGITVSRQLSGMNAITLGSELTLDYNLKHKMEADSLYGKSYLLAGFMAGHEFLMGRFNFSQLLGIYLFNQSGYYTLLYQRYGLTYSITKNWAAGINLKAHGNEANFLDGRLIYSF